MSTSINESHSTSPAVFSVEWPLTRENAVNRRQTIAIRATGPQIKHKKTGYRNNVEQNQTPSFAETNTQLYHHNSCSSVTAGNDEIVQHASKRTVPNIFTYLDHEEAIWLAKEVNEANKSIFVEVAAKRFKRDDEILDQTKSSLSTSISLLGDLRSSIRYPDEELAKDLDMWDEVSANFGVRNMVNCLGLLSNFFSQLQKEMKK
ncbi:uncharacterized protein LOC114527890 [Dendronephthya gigantea]|uniref:uncharacterized protein LOC114527890 n=1 Tax=Dendronephthya gigantea TaxID=151771 RepID=UPI00106AAC69|nr:uncharacterized protein LOC114527890 [Dendronephthya gigantea]